MPVKTEQQSQSWEKRGKLWHILNRAAKFEKQLINVAILWNCKNNQKLKKLWYQNVEKFSVPLEIEQ